jgi:hypothetical protein
MVPEADLIFREEGFFYQMVCAASAALTSCHFLLGTANPAKLKPGDRIVNRGIATGDRHCFPFELRREAVADNINQDDLLGSIRLGAIVCRYSG